MEEPDLIGTAAARGLPDGRRRIAVVGLFTVSGPVILLCANPLPTT